jgi:hypothetical protein
MAGELNIHKKSDTYMGAFLSLVVAGLFFFNLKVLDHTCNTKFLNSFIWILDGDLKR